MRLTYGSCVRKVTVAQPVAAEALLPHVACRPDLEGADNRAPAPDLERGPSDSHAVEARPAGAGALDRVEDDPDGFIAVQRSRPRRRGPLLGAQRAQHAPAARRLRCPRADPGERLHAVRG